MKKLITLILFFILVLSIQTFSQNCFEINSILVDACGNPEGENEMVRITIGPASLQVSNLTVTWANTANNYLGICQNANTAVTVAQLNATIQACGYILEPTGGILPANSTVLLATSQNMNPTFNSFANLADTIYMIFQCPGNTAGHFKNYGSPTPRTLYVNFGATCADTVSYIPDSLIDQSGNHTAADGATVDFDNAGNATYTNPGCQAPIVPLGATLVASDTIICLNDTVVLTASNLTGNYQSYQWTSAAGVISTPTALSTNFYNLPLGLNFAVFEITGTCGNVVYDTIYINVLSGTPVTISASGPTTFCIGDSVTLTAAGGGSYSWSTGASTASITVSSSGIYTVTATGSCGNSTASQLVIASTGPFVTITTSGPTALCAGDSVTLNALGGNTYTWSTGATTPSITVSTAGTYTVTSTNSCGTDSAQVIVTLTTTPAVNITASGPVVFCQGDSVILTANGSGTFLWSTGATTNSIVVTSTGNYVVTLTNSCGTATSSQQVTVNPASTINISASGPTTFCQGQSVTLTASGGTAYNWSTGATTPSITVIATGVYAVTASTSCGQQTATQSVTVLSPPVASISGTLSFCQGSSTVLTASGSGTFLWSTGATTASISVNTASTFTVTVTNQCGTSTATTTTTVSPLPTATLSASGPTTFCQGGSVTFTASGASSYMWSTGATSTSITVSQTGNYTVTATNTCGSSTATQSVTVNQLPNGQITIANGGLICPGSALTLSVNTTGSILWSTGATSSSINVSTAGVFSVTVTNVCGADSDVVTTTLSNIDVEFTPSVVSGVAPLLVSFTNQSTNAATYNWNFGDGGTANSTNPSHTFTSGGTYWVVLEGTKEGICFDYDSVLIEVIEIVNYTIPNVFTPNNDGINESFSFSGTGIRNFEITIYNRWGNVVNQYTSTGNPFWTGSTSKGKECNAGTYYFVAEVELINGEKRKHHGTIELIK